MNYFIEKVKIMKNGKRIKSDGIVFKIIEEILYILFVILGFYLAFLLVFDMSPPDHHMKPYFDLKYYIVITSIIIFYIYDIVSTFKKPLFENGLIIGLSLIVIDIIIVTIAFLKGFILPRSVFIIGYGIQFTLIFISKLIVLRILRAITPAKDILILGSQEELNYISSKIVPDRYNNDKIRYTASQLDRETYKLIDQVEKVYIGDSIETGDKEDVVKYCAESSTDVYLVPNIFEITLTDIKVNQIDDLLVFKLDHLGLTGEQKIMKRLLDLFVSIVGIVLVSPILIIVGVVIKLYDRGPILYKQERVTKDNKTFNLYKFRTMIVDAEKYTGPTLASENDPRITPLGRFLRASRIDELPQLFNVLKGDMSIVGPRPERPVFVDEFNKEVEGFKYRVFVKAGITGLAQVLSNYSTDPETKIKYDLLYIKQYSLLLDIKIIFNTVKTIFMREQSQGVVEEDKDNK